MGNQNSPRAVAQQILRTMSPDHSCETLERQKLQVPIEISKLQIERFE
jgi:hypothetical protein